MYSHNYKNPFIAECKKASSFILLRGRTLLLVIDRREGAIPGSRKLLRYHYGRGKSRGLRLCALCICLSLILAFLNTMFFVCRQSASLGSLSRAWEKAVGLGAPTTALAVTLVRWYVRVCACACACALVLWEGRATHKTGISISNVRCLKRGLCCIIIKRHANMMDGLREYVFGIMRLLEPIQWKHCS